MYIYVYTYIAIEWCNVEIGRAYKRNAVIVRD